MKNVFFALAFMLVGTFAFANNNINLNESNTIEIAKAEKVDGSVEVTLSCGITGTLSWTGDLSAADVIDAVEYFDDLLC